MYRVYIVKCAHVNSKGIVSQYNAAGTVASIALWIYNSKLATMHIFLQE